MSEAPIRIWLQRDDDDSRHPCETEGVTWCEDKINDYDTEYVRADLLATTERLLAETQAREKAKHAALEFSESMWVAEGYTQHADAQTALAMPSDSTALDAAIAKAKREVLLEAANWFEGDGDRLLPSSHECAEQLIRMADEVGQAHQDLKGGEQG